MSKKVFTILLLAVFMLAQFSVASAAKVSGTIKLESVPVFSTEVNSKLGWSVAGLPAILPVPDDRAVLAWARVKATPANPWQCQWVADVTTVTQASGTFTYNFLLMAAPVPVDQDEVEFAITVDDSSGVACGAAVDPAAVQGKTFIDGGFPAWWVGSPPSTEVIAIQNLAVACNTFEYWAFASDNYAFDPTFGYSGLKSWNQVTTGTFAPPAPLGPADGLLEWHYTLPATATGKWEFSVAPSDYAGNLSGRYFFRDGDPITGIDLTTDEVADCANFTDTAGHANELYVRYLADLELIAGNPDGTFGPDTTLTRAEAATLFEKANGLTASGLPTTPPSAACTFSDVAATDWFAGWVWAACGDGFMNGLGGGLFGPADLLTRGQVVTIINNIAVTPNAGAVGSFLEDNTTGPDTILNGFIWTLTPPIRISHFTDVSIGAFYAIPVQRAYGSGVADGTNADNTLFSPDQPALRGEFAKMLYRALSRIP